MVIGFMTSGGMKGKGEKMETKEIDVSAAHKIADNLRDKTKELPNVVDVAMAVIVLSDKLKERDKHTDILLKMLSRNTEISKGFEEFVKVSFID